jgi:hypothetical protein
LPIEELLAGSQSGTPTPQPAGAPQAGDPPAPMPIEQLGSAGATSVPEPGPDARKDGTTPPLAVDEVAADPT